MKIPREAMLNLLTQKSKDCINPYTAPDGRKFFGILQGVRREDGSGESFLLDVLDGEKVVTIHCRIN